MSGNGSLAFADVDNHGEVPLAGGELTSGIVRVADTIRRPQHDRSPYVHAVLEQLEQAGFDGAPRLLGVDERDREILSFIPGEVYLTVPARITDARLESAARLIRAFHDATAGTALAGDAEVVCHGDLGPHNIVFDGDEAVAIIDWDDGVAPGSRLSDLAHAVWGFADVGHDETEIDEQARKLALMCDAYGWENRVAIIDEIGARFRRARDAHAAAGRAAAVVIFEQMMRWMEQNGAALKDAI